MRQTFACTRGCVQILNHVCLLRVCMFMSVIVYTYLYLCVLHYEVGLQKLTEIG